MFELSERQEDRWLRQENIAREREEKETNRTIEHLQRWSVVAVVLVVVVFFSQIGFDKDSTFKHQLKISDPFLRSKQHECC